MAKFTGATTQSTQKSNPTLDKGVADSILDQLGETVIVEDEVAQAAPVEGEILEGMGGTELTPSAPTYSPQTGVSPEGNVLPLKQRAAMAVEDQLNPNIHTNAPALQRQTPVGRLRGDGSMVGQDSMPLPTYRAKASISPLMSITQRGENMAAGLKDRTISGNWHFHGDDAPVMAQYRKDGVMTEAVKLALEKKRDDILKEMHEQLQRQFFCQLIALDMKEKAKANLDALLDSMEEEDPTVRKAQAKAELDALMDSLEGG